MVLNQPTMKNERIIIIDALLSFQIILVYNLKQSILKYLADYGKLSITNCMFQAVFGVIFFYGFINI